MKLFERLAQMIGHDIVINYFDEDDSDVPPGSLIEVGEDFLAIQTKSDEEGGFAEQGAHWFVVLEDIKSIIHMDDCTACAIAAASAVEPRGRPA